MPLRLLRAVPAAALVRARAAGRRARAVRPVRRGGPISAYPSPGTISAGRGRRSRSAARPASRLGTIRVTGSRSGRHRGPAARALGRPGRELRLRRRFRGGERVTVRTGLPMRGTRNGDFTFRVARIPTAGDDPEPASSRTSTRSLVRRFRSRRDLAPPFLNVDRRAAGRPRPGYLFLSPKSKKDQKQAGPMIADDAGQPVWFQPLPGVQAATDFRTQTYKGKPVLTYWRAPRARASASARWSCSTSPTA